MSDKDNDNDRYKDGVIKHPDVIKKEMEQEKAELENFYRQWTYKFEDFIKFLNENDIYINNKKVEVKQ